MNIKHDLKQTAEHIKKIRPSYEHIVDFYTEVFLAQERFKEKLVLDPLVISQDLLNIKKKNNLPLIDQTEFKIDIPVTCNLLVILCDIAITHAPQMADDARTIKRAVLENQIDVDLLLSAILNNWSDTINDISSRIDVPPEHLMMLGYLSMVPNIEVGREQLLTYLETEDNFQEGYCPICGNTPELALLDKDGKRHLQCSFCHHNWPVDRMGCVFCGDDTKNKQHYFYSEEEKEYRVYMCDHCQNYIKVVDLRQMDREFISSLEMISTLHLDMTAREKGYTTNGSKN